MNCGRRSMEECMATNFNGRLLWKEQPTRMMHPFSWILSLFVLKGSIRSTDYYYNNYYGFIDTDELVVNCTSGNARLILELE